MKTFILLAALAALGIVAGAGFVYSGVYNMAADEPHWPATFKLIETLRERSIKVRAVGIKVPKLDDPKLISEGAAHYPAMCAGCHLAPGMEDTEIRKGLYPQPPSLSEHKHGESHADMDMQAMAARQFWIIKHGIKMTAMPAWGTTHSDEAIWGLVAFLQKLPGMTPEEYVALAGGEGGSHDHGAHPHGATESGDSHTGHGHAAEPAPAGHIDPPGAPAHSHGDSKNAKGAGEGHDHAH
ncbi:MAG: c-type cytochrome [Gammaproteobacteria bacterium]